MVDDSRARLIAYLCQAGLSTARANAVIDDYIHGLAERQRSFADGTLKTFGEQEQVAGRATADLIDPKVAA